MNGPEADAWDHSGDTGKESLIIYYTQCNLRVKDNKTMGIRFSITDKVK